MDRREAAGQASFRALMLLLCTIPGVGLLAVLSNRISAYVTGAAIVVDGGLSLTNWFEPPEL